MFFRTLVMSLSAVGGMGAMMCNGRIPLASLTCGLGVSTPPSALPTNGQSYAMMASAGDQFEIQSSQIALIKAVSPSVRNFAQTLINDHTTLDSQLSAAAVSAGFAAPIPMLSAAQQQMINDLQLASSANFDQLFLRDQIMAHEMALAMHSNYASVGDSPALRVVASSAVPVIQSHLNTATTLMIASGGMMANAFCPANYWCNSDFDALGTSFSVCCPSDIPLLPPVSISGLYNSAPLYASAPAPIYASSAAPIYASAPANVYSASTPANVYATASIPSASAAASLVCVGGKCAVYGSAPVGTPATVVNPSILF